MITVFDLLLLIIAAVFMLAGFSKRLQFMGSNASGESCTRNWKDLASYLFLHKKIMLKPFTGMAHLVLLWGFIIFTVVMLAAQFDVILPPSPAKALSMFLDILGIVLLIAISFFLVRHLQKRSSKEKTIPERLLFPGMIILCIVITGFLAEGARLSIMEQTFQWYSPVGWLFSLILPESPLFMQWMIRVHFFLVVIFLGSMPFTFMRHAPAAALNILCDTGIPTPDSRTTPAKTRECGLGSVTDLSWKQRLDAEACVSCGRCVDNCPAAISGKPLSPEKILQKLRGAMEDDQKGQALLLGESITPEEIWSCTTCMACVEQCPVFTNPAEKIIGLRKHKSLFMGDLPAEARPMIRNLEIFGDTQGKGTAHKTDWFQDSKVNVLSEANPKTDILLWVGCSGAFHPRYRNVMQDMVKILDKAGVNFAVLGRQELCCGDPARRLGGETLFHTLAKKNIHIMDKYEFKKIVALCPHCLHTLKNDYAALGADLDVVHASELVVSLIRENKINLRYPMEKSLTIHDPCYLGRINNIYTPLREISTTIPGIEVKELSREFCCGGGGGQMWLHDSIGRHINHIRAEDIVDSEAGIAATACPYCLTMLDDGISASEMDSPPRVVDIIELVASSI